MSFSRQIPNLASHYRRKGAHLSLAAAVAAVLASQSASATILTWKDSDTSNTWNLTTTTNWVGGVAWNNTTPDEAIFGGTGETVTLGVPIIAAGLTFNSNGYTIGNGGTAANTLTLGGATPTITVTDVAHTATISAVIKGTTGLTKGGAGTLTLSGMNTYTGATVINAGVLSVDTLANGGANSSIGASSSAAGNLSLGGGTLRYTGGTVTTDRAFALTASSTMEVANAATTLTFASSIAGNPNSNNPIFTKTGSGTLVLSGNGDNSGLVLAVTSGEVDLGKGTGAGARAVAGINSVAAGAIVKLTGAGTDQIYDGSNATNRGVNGLAGTLDLNGHSETTSNFSGTSTGVVTNSAASTNVIWTVGGANATSSFAGKIEDGSGTIALSKIGTGTQTLTGASTYTGGTTVNAGTLQLDNVTAAGTGGITVNNGGKLSLGAAVSNAITLAGGTLGLSKAVTIPSTATLTVNSPSTINTFNPATDMGAFNLVLAGKLLGAGDINLVSKNGTNPDGAGGAFRLTGQNSDYSGTITVGQSAKFELQATAATGSPMGTGKLVVTGGTPTTAANGTFSLVNVRNSFTGSTTFTNDVEVVGTGASYFNMLGTVSTVNFGDLKIGDGQSIAAVATGTGGFTLAFKSVHLTGGNATFTPKPTAEDSSFKATQNISLGTITEDVPNSGITMNGAATLTLTGNNTYTGTTTVSSGTLKVSGRIAGSSQITVLNSGSLILTGASADQIGDTAPLTLGNGAGSSATLQLENTSATPITETVGALTLVNNSIIDFGTGNGYLLQFANSSGNDWAGNTLSIYNWTSGTDHLFFGNGTTGLLESQLNSITFYAGGAGSQSLGSAMFVSGGELAPVPEPTTLASGLVMLGYVFFHRRRGSRWTDMGRRDS